MNYSFSLQDWCPLNIYLNKWFFNDVIIVFKICCLNGVSLWTELIQASRKRIVSVVHCISLVFPSEAVGFCRILHMHVGVASYSYILSLGKNHLCGCQHSLLWVRHIFSRFYFKAATQTKMKVSQNCRRFFKKSSSSFYAKYHFSYLYGLEWHIRRSKQFLIHLSALLQRTVSSSLHILPCTSTYLSSLQHHISKILMDSTKHSLLVRSIFLFLNGTVVAIYVICLWDLI